MDEFIARWRFGKGYRRSEGLQGRIGNSEEKGGLRCHKVKTPSTNFVEKHSSMDTMRVR